MWATLLALRTALPEGGELHVPAAGGEGGNVMGLTVRDPSDLLRWLECDSTGASRGLPGGVGCPWRNSFSPRLCPWRSRHDPSHGRPKKKKKKKCQHWQGDPGMSSQRALVNGARGPGISPVHYCDKVELQSPAWKGHSGLEE